MSFAGPITLLLDPVTDPEELRKLNEQQPVGQRAMFSNSALPRWTSGVQDLRRVALSVRRQ